MTTTFTVKSEDVQEDVVLSSGVFVSDETVRRYSDGIGRAGKHNIRALPPYTQRK